MKKRVLTTVTFVLAVATAQAVSLTWGGTTPSSRMVGPTGSELTTGAGSETASIMVYYILASDYGNVTDQTTAASYAKATAAGATSVAGTGRIGTSTPISGSSAGISYYARVYATIGGTAYYMDVKNGGTTAYWLTSVNDPIPSEALGWSVATYGGTTGVAGDYNKWIAVPVPEPTSLALFGLGAAVLGLRRRFKKKA